jgi:hypothetical protein
MLVLQNRRARRQRRERRRQIRRSTTASLDRHHHLLQWRAALITRLTGLSRGRIDVGANLRPMGLFLL